jgi:hypothetical protein
VTFVCIVFTATTKGIKNTAIVDQISNRNTRCNREETKSAREKRPAPAVDLPIDLEIGIGRSKRRNRAEIEARGAGMAAAGQSSKDPPVALTWMRWSWMISAVS